MTQDAVRSQQAVVASQHNEDTAGYEEFKSETFASSYPEQHEPNFNQSSTQNLEQLRYKQRERPIID